MSLKGNLKTLTQLATTHVEDRRREARQELVGGIAVIDGQRLLLWDWSPHGFRIGPCDLAPKVGDRLEITFIVSLPEQVFEFTCQTAVMRVEPERKAFAGVYFNYDHALRARIDEHFDVVTAKSYGRDVIGTIKSALRLGRRH